MSWFAAIHDVGGGACGSSNQHASAHRRTQPGRQGGIYLDCAHSAGISFSPAGDRVTASPVSLVFLDCGVCLFVFKP